MSIVSCQVLISSYSSATLLLSTFILSWSARFTPPPAGLLAGLGRAGGGGAAATAFSFTNAAASSGVGMGGGGGGGPPRPWGTRAGARLGGGGATAAKRRVRKVLKESVHRASEIGDAMRSWIKRLCLTFGHRLTCAKKNPEQVSLRVQYPLDVSRRKGLPCEVCIGTNPGRFSTGFRGRACARRDTYGLPRCSLKSQ